MMTTTQRIWGWGCSALLALIAFTAPTLAADLTLFPDAGSFNMTPIQDGDPTFDATGGITGQIVITSPVPVPGTGGAVTFMGTVEEILVPPISNNLPAERLLRITEIPPGFSNAGTPATFTNISNNTFTLQNDVILAALDYAPQLANWPAFGSGLIPALQLNLDGWLETTGTFDGAEGIQMHVSASTQFIDGSLGGLVTAEWANNTSQSTGSINVLSNNLEEGDFDGNPGTIRLTMDRLHFTADSSYHFPTSIVAGTVMVPEPGSLMLLGMGSLMLLKRRRRSKRGSASTTA